METIIITHSDSEYNEILRQAVAVIETARSKAARAIVESSNEMHWEIGKLLYERKSKSRLRMEPSIFNSFTWACCKGAS